MIWILCPTIGNVRQIRNQSLNCLLAFCDTIQKYLILTNMSSLVDSSLFSKDLRRCGPEVKSLSKVRITIVSFVLTHLSFLQILSYCLTIWEPVFPHKWLYS